MGTCPAGFPYAQWRDRVCNFGEVAEAKRRARRRFHRPNGVTVFATLTLQACEAWLAFPYTQWRDRVCNATQSERGRVLFLVVSRRPMA